MQNSMIGYITRVLEAFKACGAFSEQELKEIEAMMFEIANYEERDITHVKADKNIIASSFSSIAVQGHKFKVREGEKVIVHELLCEVKARDFSRGLVLVQNEFWGARWVSEDSCIRIAEIFTLGLLKDAVKTAFSPKFLEHFKAKIGREKSLDMDHQMDASGYLEYDKTQSIDLSKIDKK